jgi:hypothetical protein
MISDDELKQRLKNGVTQEHYCVFFLRVLEFHLN